MRSNFLMIITAMASAIALVQTMPSLRCGKRLWVQSETGTYCLT